MSEKRIWFSRRFRFDIPLDCYPNVVERLRGTPARLEEAIASIPENAFPTKPGGAWSILENIGHLSDVEELWIGRIGDFRDGVTTMRPADLQSRKTHGADHNDHTAAELAAKFRSDRERLMQALDALSEEDFAKTALHPRLEQPMRQLDLCVFVAEHDDHHLATIKELERSQT